jgi:hypothetical protein
VLLVVLEELEPVGAVNINNRDAKRLNFGHGQQALGTSLRVEEFGLGKALLGCLPAFRPCMHDLIVWSCRFLSVYKQ